jgi:mono/diheme cytochrome c family protein
MKGPNRNGAVALAGSLLLGIAGAGWATPAHASPKTGASGFENPKLTRNLTAAERRGRNIWFKSTFGGEKFFGLILPEPPFGLRIGFDQLLTSDRATRFREYGVLNDPDCRPGDASTGYWDRCADPNSAGVVGLRKFTGAQGETLVGVTCAACHAGLDPAHPPKDPNRPAWSNIHPTVGNQYIRIGKVFSTHLSPHDPRYQVFQTWAPGTVDTTAIESDHINNPGIITQFFNLPDRPFFDLTQEGSPIRVHRSGQGGEDDTGCENAGLRVFFNIGMCARECMVGHLANGPGGTQTPIDKDQCRAACPEFRQAEQAMGDMCAFMETARPPLLSQAPRGARFVDRRVVKAGERVFEAECAACHSNGRRGRRDVLSDDLIHPADEIGTNLCRALTSNWEAGHIWAEFSSDQYKARPTGGPGFYRDVPLLGLWATAPFLHNNRLGAYTGDPSVQGRLAAYEDAMRLLLNPEERTPLIPRTTDSIVIGANTLPAGTPVGAFANVDPARPAETLCADFDETKGHPYGSGLSAAGKYALKEYLKTR